MIGCHQCGQVTSGDCGQHRVYWIPKQACRCPVCEGRGHVPNGFYGSFAGLPWTTSSVAPETCKSCEGKGYVSV